MCNIVHRGSKIQPQLQRTTDNGHGPVADSPNVLLYSTGLRIIIKIVTVMPTNNLMTLINLTYNNQSDDLISVLHFNHLNTMMYFSTILWNSESSITSCHIMHACKTSSESLYLIPLDPNNLPGQNILVPFNTQSCMPQINS